MNLSSLITKAFFSGFSTDDKPDDCIFCAITLAMLNAIFLSTMNMFAKLLGDMFPPEQITFTRNIVALVLLTIGLVVFRKFSVLKTKRLPAHALRASIGTVALFLSIWAYTIMPLANATVLIFTQPLWVALLSYPLLGEKVGVYRLIAVLIGFSGILVVASPDSGFNSYNLTVGLSAGFAFGLVALCLRWMGRTECPAATVFYFVLFGSIMTAFFLPFSGNMPDMENIHFIVLASLGLGLFGLASLMSKTSSYRFGDASLIAPVNYTMIIWAGLFDYFIWGNVPSLRLITGAGIIIASNLFILWRERNCKAGHMHTPEA